MEAPARPKARILLAVLLSLTLLFVLFRLAFLTHFEGLASITKPGAMRALYLGFKFDVRLAGLLVMPVWLLLEPAKGSLSGWWGRLAPLGLILALGLYAAMVIIAQVDTNAAKPWLLVFLAACLAQRRAFLGAGLDVPSVRWVWTGYAVLALGAVFLTYIVDFGTYGYIHTRLNGTLLMFLENAGISLQMMWESYPVLRLAAALAALLAGSLWLLRRAFAGMGTGRFGGAGLWAIRVGLSLALLFAMWGKVSRYPLRWAEAFEAKHGFHAHLALNPVLFFLETRRDMDGGFDLAKVRASQPVMAEYFGTDPKQEEGGLPSLRREREPRPLVQGTPNVVFIQLESFAAFKTGILGNRLDPTPFFDDLCRKGLFFDRFYVAMENTSRSMFASLFGIPDVSAVENATRNPLLLDQHTPLRALDAYDKTFFLGGSANWAQIRGILRNNFKDLTIFEEGSYASPVVDVWGICDADLLLEANARLRGKKGPFWSYIQTSGSHPPFTIPTHLKGFESRKLDSAALKAGGFEGDAEYNAVRLMDYSLKLYFEAAAKEAYFRNTVFVLWADHGIPRGSTDKRFGDLGLPIHHIPCLIYAPGLIPEGRRISTIGTQMDLMPTLMSLLGHKVSYRTLGKDLLDPAFAEKSAAFTFTTFRRPPRVGLIQGDWYVNLEPDGRPSLFRLDDPDPKDRASDEPERTAKMKAQAEGFHHWAKFLLSHNKPMEAGK